MKFLGAAWRIGWQLIVLVFVYAVVQVPRTPFEIIVVAGLVLLVAMVAILHLTWIRNARNTDRDNRLLLHELWKMTYRGDNNDDESCDRAEGLIGLQKDVLLRNRHDDTSAAFLLIAMVYATSRIIGVLLQ